MKLLREYIRLKLWEKKWTDLGAPRGQVISLSPADFEDDAPPGVRDLDDEIFDLIQTAYADVEISPGQYGNIKVQSPADLPGKYTIMKAADLDADPEPDYFRGGKPRGGRFKLGIVGHDGTKVAIQKYLEETAEDLKSGAIGEMSGKIATNMIKRGVPAVTTQAEVEALLGKKVIWKGRHPVAKYAEKYDAYGDYEGWYSRDISGAAPGEHMKILLGGV